MEARSVTWGPQSRDSSCSRHLPLVGGGAEAGQRVPVPSQPYVHPSARGSRARRRPGVDPKRLAFLTQREHLRPGRWLRSRVGSGTRSGDPRRDPDGWATVAS